MKTNGLTDKQIKQFLKLLTSANLSQLDKMALEIQAEKSRKENWQLQ